MFDYFAIPIVIQTAAFDRTKYGMNPEHRALALLQKHLTREQCDQFNSEGRFVVRAQVGRYHWRDFWILKCYSYCVMDIETGEKFCAVAPGVPLMDHILTIKLLLQSDPKYFFEVAIRSGIPHPSERGNFPHGYPF